MHAVVGGFCVVADIFYLFLRLEDHLVFLRTACVWIAPNSHDSKTTISIMERDAVFCFRVKICLWSQGASVDEKELEHGVTKNSSKLVFSARAVKSYCGNWRNGDRSWFLERKRNYNQYNLWKKLMRARFKNWEIHTENANNPLIIIHLRNFHKRLPFPLLVFHAQVSQLRKMNVRELLTRIVKSIKVRGHFDNLFKLHGKKWCKHKLLLHTSTEM